MWENWVWSLGWEDPWRREWQTTLVFLPAWRIPRTNEPGELQFMGSQRVGHKWAANTIYHHVFRGEANVMRTVHSVCVSSHGLADPQRKATLGGHLGWASACGCARAGGGLNHSPVHADSTNQSVSGAGDTTWQTPASGSETTARQGLDISRVVFV